MIDRTTPTKIALKGSVAGLTLLSAFSAQAQNATPAAAPPAATSAGEATAEAIVVTGTLIRNPNLQSSSPILVTGAEEIRLKQSNTAEELLRTIPGIVPSIGSAVNNGNGGASTLDLRGLGPSRNLVLVDGNRITGYDSRGVVDTNIIPLALISRVESLTGGASTTYGADAIAGVANFVTNKNFSGVEITGSEQITERGDGNYYRTDLTIGGNFDGGKGNAVLSIGYQHADPIYQGARDFSLFQVDTFSGNLGGSGTTVPSRFSIFDPTIPNPSPLPPGRTVTRQLNPNQTALVPTYATFNFNPYNIFQTPFERFNVFASAHYDISDKIEIYSRAIFSKNTVDTIIAPSGSFGSSVTIPYSNPYLPRSVALQFCNGVRTNGVSTPLTVAQCDAARAATSPTDPNYRTFTANLSRRFVEAPGRTSDYVTNYFDYRAGIKGEFNSKISWDLNGSYGESDQTQNIDNYVLTSRLRQALLATNTTSCLDTSNNCVPVNVFGPAGSITPAQANFVIAPSTVSQRSTLVQVRGIVNADTGFVSPFATDAINIAAGAEYRRYSYRQRPDFLASQAGQLGGAGGATLPVQGAYSVEEGFAELAIPLVQNQPFVESLTFETGVRQSHYDVDAVGSPSYDTTTYKFQGTWALVRDFRIRGGYSQSVRAPNIGELFTPVNTVLTNLAVDPCAGNAPLNNANLRAICIAQGAPASAIGGINNPTAGQANTTTGGNPQLGPETSRSFTVGFLTQPRYVQGLSIGVDYYSIAVSGAITTPSSGNIISGCFTGNYTPASVNNPNCALIRRNPVSGQLDGDPATTPGLLTALTNSGRIFTNGLDFTANYRRNIGPVKLTLDFVGNYTFHNKFLAQPGASIDNPNRDCVGFYSANCASIQPQFQWNQRTTFNFENLDLSVLWRHIDSNNYEFGAGAPCGSPGNATAADDAISGNSCAGKQFSHIKPYDYFDLTLKVAVGPHLDFNFGVDNLFDRQPPVVGGTAGSTAYNSGNTYPSTYDAQGRKLKFSARLKF